MQDKITTADIRKLLREKYSDHREYAYAEEIGNSTGIGQTRRLDMVVVNCYQSSGFSIEGIEIKTIKSDLRKELQDSSKHNIFYNNLDYYSLAAPYDIVDIDLIPKHWGIYLVHRLSDGSLKLRTRRKPLSLHDKPIDSVDKPFIATLLRAMWNSRPSDSLIEVAKKEERERVLKDANLDMYVNKIKNLQLELDQYKQLKEKLNIWSISNTTQSIEEYENFKKLNIHNLRYSLKMILNAEDDIKNALKIIETIEDKFNK